MPEEVKVAFGAAILDVQFGDTPAMARPFREGLPKGVMKLVEDHDRGTYRVAYAAAFEKCVYILHAFQKKSKTGIATPQADINLVDQRFKAACADYARTYMKSRSTK